MIKNWLVAAWCGGAIAAAFGLPVWLYCTTLRSMQTHQDLKWISLALHQYHDRYGSFPPVVLRDENQNPLHSWRTLIQPELVSIAKTSDQFASYDFTQPWNSPANAESQRRHRFGRYPYQILAVVGPHAAWDEHAVRKLSDFKDGTHHTVLAVALRHTNTQWNEPRDLAFDGEGLYLGDQRIELTEDVHLVMGDGSVRYCVDGIPWKTLQPMLTIDGGEKVDW